jgi:hypothetical protein
LLIVASGIFLQECCFWIGLRWGADCHLNNILNHQGAEQLSPTRNRGILIFEIGQRVTLSKEIETYYKTKQAGVNFKFF